MPISKITRHVHVRQDDRGCVEVTVYFRLSNDVNSKFLQSYTNWIDTNLTDTQAAKIASFPVLGSLWTSFNRYAGNHFN